MTVISGWEWNQFCIEVRKTRYDSDGVARSEYYIPEVYSDVWNDGTWFIVATYREDDIIIRFERQFSGWKYKECRFIESYPVTEIVGNKAFLSYFRNVCWKNSVSHCDDGYELMVGLVRKANVEWYGV